MGTRKMRTPNLQLRKRFGRKIRDLRKTKGYSQEELGFRTRIHRTYIGSVERGEQNISLDNIGRLAHALEVKLPELFSD